MGSSDRRNTPLSESCHKWLADVGIDVKKHSRAQRPEYFRLRKSGVSRADATRQTGLNLRTAIDWDQGIEHANNRRVYPDRRIVDYNKEVAPLSETRQRLLLPLVERKLDARYLSPPDREKIRDLPAAGAGAVNRRSTRSPGLSIAPV